MKKKWEKNWEREREKRLNVRRDDVDSYDSAVDHGHGHFRSFIHIEMIKPHTT